MELGGKFWLTFVAAAVAAAIVGIVFFLVMEAAWLRWGFLGMCLFFSAVLLLFGWIYDRRDRKRRRDALEAARMAP